MRQLEVSDSLNENILFKMNESTISDWLLFENRIKDWMDRIDCDEYLWNMRHM